MQSDAYASKTTYRNIMCVDIERRRLEKDMGPPLAGRTMEGFSFPSKSPYGILTSCANLSNQVVRGGVVVVNLHSVTYQISQYYCSDCLLKITKCYSHLLQVVCQLRQTCVIAIAECWFDKMWDSTERYLTQITLSLIENSVLPHPRNLRNWHVSKRSTCFKTANAIVSSCSTHGCELVCQSVACWQCPSLESTDRLLITVAFMRCLLRLKELSVTLSFPP